MNGRRFAACALLLCGCGDGVVAPIRGSSVIATGSSDAAAEPLDAGADAQAQADVPAGPHCAAAAQWSQSDADAELELLQRLNDVRSDPRAPCAPRDADRRDALELRAELRCAARLHTSDMLARRYFSQINPEREDPGERMREAGYDAVFWGEMILAGVSDPMRALQQILGDPASCRTLATPDFRDVGAGLRDGVWTIDFAARSR